MWFEMTILSVSRNSNALIDTFLIQTKENKRTRTREQENKRIRDKKKLKICELDTLGLLTYKQTFVFVFVSKNI